MNLPIGTVYIVEDNNSFRKSLVRLVQTFGHRVAAFESAASFLSQTAYQYPGCILLDVRLPDMDGLELQETLNQNGCRLPIVFISGHGDIPMSIAAMKKGAVDFLPKPFDPEDLSDAIIQALIRNTSETQDDREK